MFSWDEVFGTRNKDGSWDLEITGTNSDFNGDSCEQKITIKGANIDVEMSPNESPNVSVKVGSDTWPIEWRSYYL